MSPSALSNPPLMSPIYIDKYKFIHLELYPVVWAGVGDVISKLSSLVRPGHFHVHVFLWSLKTTFAL